MLDRRSALKNGAAAMAVIATSAQAAPSNGKALNTLFDKFVQEDLDLSPTNATALGLDVGARAHQRAEIDDASLAGIARQKAVTADQLKQLQAFGRASLSGQ